MGNFRSSSYKLVQSDCAYPESTENIDSANVPGGFGKRSRSEDSVSDRSGWWTHGDKNSPNRTSGVLIASEGPSCGVETGSRRDDELELTTEMAISPQSIVSSFLVTDFSGIELDRYCWNVLPWQSKMRAESLSLSVPSIGSPPSIIASPRLDSTTRGSSRRR